MTEPGDGICFSEFQISALFARYFSLLIKICHQQMKCCWQLDKNGSFLHFTDGGKILKQFQGHAYENLRITIYRIVYTCKLQSNTAGSIKINQERNHLGLMKTFH